MRHPVWLRSGGADGMSRLFGRVHIGVTGKPVYGDLLGPRRSAVAVPVICDNGGGTAAGQLASAYAVFREQGSRLSPIGMVTAQYRPRDVHITLVSGLRMQPGTLTVREYWYRPRDGDCCPSGRAIARWTYDGRRLVPRDALAVHS